MKHRTLTEAWNATWPKLSCFYLYLFIYFLFLFSFFFVWGGGINFVNLCFEFAFTLFSSSKRLYKSIQSLCLEFDCHQRLAFSSVTEPRIIVWMRPANLRRHQMESFPHYWPFVRGFSPVTGEFPSQRPVTRSFDAFLDLRLNKRLSKQWWSWLCETPSR